MTAAIAYIAFAALVIGIAVYTAPEGYQDGDGFHLGDEHANPDNFGDQ